MVCADSQHFCLPAFTELQERWRDDRGDNGAAWVHVYCTVTPLTEPALSRGLFGKFGADFLFHSVRHTVMVIRNERIGARELEEVLRGSCEDFRSLMSRLNHLSWHYGGNG